MMKDYFVRSLSSSGGVRVMACTTAETTREICQLQGSALTASIALGRGIAAGALMGALLKDGQRVALKFEGNGPLKRMIIEADSDGALRAYAAVPEAEVEPLDNRWNVPGLLGRAGFLTVTKDLGMGGEPYHGMVQLRSSEIGDDLAYYLADSEQIPSAVGLGAQLDTSGKISDCGGFLVQALPQALEGEIELIMENIVSLPPLTDLLRDGGPKLLLERLYGDISYNLLEEREVFFRCGCSRIKSKQALLMLGPAELVEMVEKENGAEVVCEFCRQFYHFDRDEVLKMANGRKQKQKQ
jgi:molecular chaperone Hsp33